MADNRGVAYMGPGTVEVQDIDFPTFELQDGPGVNPANVGRPLPHAAILKMVSTNICGSDQHMVRGRTTAPEGLAEVEAVGFEARGHGKDADHEAPATVLNSIMDVTRGAGKLGIPGLYVTGDPGGIDEAAKVGSLSIRLGLGWAKSHSFTTGQTPVMRYHYGLMQMILNDKAQIAKAVNATVISLDEAPQGYEDFDKGAAKKFVFN